MRALSDKFEYNHSREENLAGLESQNAFMGE